MLRVVRTQTRVRFSLCLGVLEVCAGDAEPERLRLPRNDGKV
eukprot:gene22708-40284_t